MERSCFVRKIDELGRIVLPIEIRKSLNIQEKDSLEIFLKDDGIFLKKDQDLCTFCNSELNVETTFNSKKICNDCLKLIKEVGVGE